MNRSGNDNDTMRLLLHKHLSGETTAEEDRQVEAYLTKHPDAQREFQEMDQIRSVLRKAVSNESLPESLRTAIESKTIDSKFIFTQSSSSFRLYYAAAAVVLLLVGGWFILQKFQSEVANDSPVIVENVDDSLKSVQQVLQVGMKDHLRCAVAFHKGDIPNYGLEKMRRKLAGDSAKVEGDFSGLIPVVEEKIKNGELLVAHKCKIGGRGYVHMIIKDEERMVSLVITRKKKGESLANRAGVTRTVSDIPIYQAAMEGYEIAGFDADKFLVFVASDFPEKQNLQMISSVAEPIKEVLKTI